MIYGKVFKIRHFAKFKFIIYVNILLSLTAKGCG